MKAPSKPNHKRPKRSAKDKERDDFMILFESWFADRGMERTTDYVRRGRQHANLSEADLREAWIAAYEAVAPDPVNSPLRALHEDLQAEFDLRCIKPPLEAVAAATEILKAKAREFAARLEQGDNWEKFNERLFEDFAKWCLTTRN